MVVQCIGNSHLNGCSDVKDEVAMLSIFLDKTTKSLHKSKVSVFLKFFVRHRFPIIIEIGVFYRSHWTNTF